VTCSSVGLGSCIGLVLVCRRGRACGCIVLPAPGGRATDRPAKFGRRSALIAALGRTARLNCLNAVLIGGAQMLTTSTGMEIGARNEEAVRAALLQAGIRDGDRNRRQHRPYCPRARRHRHRDRP
jgi:chemotaxis receptor (MCP) glutamine deamidase CheD